MLLVVLTNSQNRSAYFDDTQVSKTKDLGSSATDTKSRSPAKDLKTDDLPPLGPEPTTGSPLPASPVNIPAIPEIPTSTPPPSSKPAPSAPPSQSTPAPAPAKSGAMPK